MSGSVQILCLRILIWDKGKGKRDNGQTADPTKSIATR